MQGVLGVLLAVTGVLLMIVPAVSSRFGGRMHGLGTTSHLTADAIAVVGLLLLLTGSVTTALLGGRASRTGAATHEGSGALGVSCRSRGSVMVRGRRYCR
jgi:hypothetical protein